MYRIMICFLVVLELLSVFIIAIQIGDKADKDRNKNITTALWNYIKELFYGRNCFGVILSSIVFIIGIPAFLLIILIQLFVSFIRCVIKIWYLGNKKQKEI